MNKVDIFSELLSTINYQEEVIKHQRELIEKLVNENLEQENFINEMASTIN